MLEFSDIVVGLRLWHKLGPAESMQAVVIDVPETPGRVANMDRFARIAFENGEWSSVDFLTLRDQKYYAKIDVVSSEQVAAVVAFHDYYRTNPDAAKTRKQHFQVEVRTKLHIEFPHLSPRTSTEYVNPCPNIRRHLKHHFPDAKFAVRLRSYSTVELDILKGTVDRNVVAKVVSPFVSGFFNQWDSFTYVPSVFRNEYGGTRYVDLNDRRPA